jgi:carbonic anhydrase
MTSYHQKKTFSLWSMPQILKEISSRHFNFNHNIYLSQLQTIDNKHLHSTSGYVEKKVSSQIVAHFVHNDKYDV